MALDDFDSVDAPIAADSAELGLATFEEDDDLFNFDELAGGDIEPEYPSEVVEMVDASRRHVPAPSAPAKPAPAPARQAEAPAPAPAPAAATPIAISMPAAASLVPGRPWVVLALVGGIFLINVLMVAIAWKSLDTTNTAMREIGRGVMQSADAMRAETAQRVSEVIDWQEPEIASGTPEGYETIENALRDLEYGDFSRARQRLYALLAVADRLDQSDRTDLEARARLLIAESYRLEADRIEGEQP